MSGQPYAPDASTTGESRGAARSGALVTFPHTGPCDATCDDVDTLWPGVDEEVIPVLYVEDADRAVSWYERLGFRKEWEHQFEPGFPWFLSVARGSVRLYLSEHKGDARPNTLIHLYVNDIDVVSHEFGIPVDEDGLAGRECDLQDPDGNRLRVATRRS
jgi:catechol 2,3-dioxygenase-like lactoylglutathione lyase family enzyme